jgi:prepilin-type N-terminal cleavage/methylation domain-containing protein
MRRHRATASDQGFTLIELLVVVLILGLIIGPLSDVVVGFLRNNDETMGRLSESHDVQIASAYWAQDVASVGTRQTTAPYGLNQSIEVGAATATPTWPYQCGTGGTVIVRFAWDDFSTSGVNTFIEVTYQTASGKPNELHRIRCNGSATPVSDTVMAHDLDPSQAPALGCPNLPTVPATCSAATVPTTVTLTLYVKDPKDRNSSPYTVKLTGQRRQAQL